MEKKFQYDLNDYVCVDVGGECCYKIINALWYEDKELYEILNIYSDRKVVVTVPVEYLNNYNHLKKNEEGKYAIKITTEKKEVFYLESLTFKKYNYANVRSSYTINVEDAVKFINKRKAKSILSLFNKFKGWQLEVFEIKKQEQ